MKKNITYKLSLVAAFFALLVTSCKKDFLDVNQNENFPEQVDVKYALPAAQAYLGYTMGNQLAIAGGFWGQYWTQGPNANQYAQLDQYIYTSSEADRPWEALYSGTLKDLDFIYEKSKSDPAKQNYGAIARILQVYTYQVVVDAWGMAPFREALKGSDNVSPKFDKEELVYDSLAVWIDEGLNLLDDTKAAPGSEDLVYGGNLLSWYKFGNTLKLKLFLRQAAVRPSVAALGISNTDPVFLEEGDDAYLKYNNAKFQQNPLYTTANIGLQTTSNIFASKSITDYMYATNDTLRLADFFNPNSVGIFNGLLQGEGKLLGGNQSDANFSLPGDEIVGATAPVYLMTASEAMFLQAEAVARGYLSGNDKNLYEAAITASWDNWTVSSQDPAALSDFLASDSVNYANATTTDQKLRLILTQKWVAMCGNQNFEAWTEERRTGYPDFLKPSVTSVLANGVFPARLVYPSDEVTGNSNFPGVKQVDEKIWWDVN